jgi:hypothetical protein
MVINEKKKVEGAAEKAEVVEKHVKKGVGAERSRPRFS